VSLLYNKEKASNAFLDKNVNILVHFFVYGFRLTIAVFMEGDLPNSFSAYNLLESRRSYFTKPYYCDVPRNIQLPLWSDHDIAGLHRIISIFNQRKIGRCIVGHHKENVRGLPTKYNVYLLVQLSSNRS
jgi:hypothetical protein